MCAELLKRRDGTMNEQEVKAVVRKMESAEGFRFPDNTLGKVLNKWEDTFCGFDLLVRAQSAS